MAFLEAPTKYSGAWPTLFKREAASLKAVCEAYLLSIDHIGSTAVAGLMAKPVLDILVEAKSGKLSELIAPLVARGFVFKGENGIPGRAYFSRPAASQLSVHIHAFEAGHAEILKHIAFRDYLRAHRELARRYGDLKAQILRAASITRDEYQEAKSEFIARVSADALVWKMRRPLREPLVAKAVAYALRERQGQLEVLVFDHVKFPAASPQVPSGTVENGERIEQAAEREFQEETGMLLTGPLEYLGSYIYYKGHIDQFQDRNIFVMRDGHGSHSLPERWTHRVTGAGEDKDLEFSYRWIRLDVARSQLKAHLGEGLEFFEELIKGI